MKHLPPDPNRVSGRDDMPQFSERRKQYGSSAKTNEEIVARRPDPAENLIARLRELREHVAALAMRLSERELEGRLLRLSVEDDLRKQGITKTDSEKGAKADSRYLDFERQTILLAHQQAVLSAEAEAIRFRIMLHLTTAEALGSVTLLGPDA
jgi:ribosomal protein S15P/S13E